MRIRSSLFALASLVAACTPLRPQVELERGVSLGKYHVFEVGAVTDASGYTLFPWPIADSLRLELVEQLQHHGLAVRAVEPDTAATPGVLILRGTLTSFRAGSPYLREPQTSIYSRCTFVTDLFDKETGRQIGHIISSEDADYMPYQVLMTCAREVGDEVAREVKSG